MEQRQRMKGEDADDVDENVALLASVDIDRPKASATHDPEWRENRPTARLKHPTGQFCGAMDLLTCMFTSTVLLFLVAGTAIGSTMPWRRTEPSLRREQPEFNDLAVGAAATKLSSAADLPKPGSERGPAAAPTLPLGPLASLPPPPPPPPLPPPPPPLPTSSVNLVGAVPSGSAAAYTAIFHGEYPAKDTGLVCKNNNRANNIVVCGDACSADVECRYFWAGIDGRCCLKSDYDNASGTRKGVLGDFYELTTRGPSPPPPPPAPLTLQGTVAPKPSAVGNGLWCESDVTTGHRVGQLTCSSAKSTAASRRGIDRVALVVVGQLKAGNEAVVMDSAHLLVSSLRRDFGDEGVDVYLCIDFPHALEFAAPRKYGDVQPTAVFEHKASHMWDRLSRCWTDVTAHARAAGKWGGASGSYKWIIRSRPDVVWWRPLPSITEWSTDAIYTRARRLGMMEHVDDEKLSWWKYMQPQWGVCDLACVWRDTRKAIGVEEGGCVVADDQFAVIPATYAGGYFGTETPNVGHHYPIPVGHENCQWPEGKMTCRILDTGAKLRLAPFSFRINKWRFVHGEGPPFSKPKDTPAVCPCNRCN